jgi:putative hydrolase of the HAD superfamily
VLVQICRSWAEACGRAAVPVRDPDWLGSEEAIGLRREIIFEYQRGGLSTEAYVEGLCRALRGLYDAAEVARVHDAWLIAEYPGVEDLVTELNARPGTVTACLSNTNHAHWSRIRPGNGEFRACAGLRRGLASHELGVSKPDPRIYAKAEARLGASPTELLFFDDTPENVAAARAAGWRAEQIDYRSGTAGQLRGWLERYGVL